MEFLTEMDGSEEAMQRLNQAEIKPEDTMQTDEWMYELRERELEKRRRFSEAQEEDTPESVAADEVASQFRVTSDHEESKITLQRKMSKRKDQPNPKLEEYSVPSQASSHQVVSVSASSCLSPLDTNKQKYQPGLEQGPSWITLGADKSQLLDGLMSNNSPSTSNGKQSYCNTTLLMVFTFIWTLPIVCSAVADAAITDTISVVLPCSIIQLFLWIALLKYHYRINPVEYSTGAKDSELLYSIIPKDIVSEIHGGSTCIAMKHNSLTFCFVDLVGFTKTSAQLHHSKLVTGLNKLFTVLDNLAGRHGVTKIKTIGDCYMSVSGFINNDVDHIKVMVDWCSDCISSFKSKGISELQLTEVQLRFGMASGPAVSGVLGLTKPIYDFWGDTVNMASRMEALSKTNRINCTKQVADHLIKMYSIQFETIEDVFVKGKGRMDTFLVKFDDEIPMAGSPRHDNLPAEVENTEMKALAELESMQSKEAFSLDMKNILYSVSSLSTVLELEKATELVVSSVRSLIVCDRATLFMVDHDNEQLWSFHNVNSNGQKIRMPMDKGVAGWTATRGECVTIQEAYEDPRFNKVVDTVTGYRTRNLLCFPIKRGEEVLAVIQAVNKLHGKFTEQDSALLALLGNQAGIHLMYGQLLEKLDQSELRTQVFNAVSQELTKTDDISQIFASVSEGARRFVQCEYSKLYIIDDRRKYLYSMENHQSSTILLGSGVAGHVAVVGEPINIRHTQSNEMEVFRDIIDLEPDGSPAIINILCVPIIDDQGVMGVFEVRISIFLKFLLL